MSQQLLTIDEFAAEFRVSRRTMEGLLQKHPVGFKVGNRWRFSQIDAARLREALECSNSPTGTGRQTGMSGALSPAAALTKAHALLTARSQKRIGPNGNGNSRTPRFTASVVALPLQKPAPST